MSNILLVIQTGPATWEAESFEGVPRVAPVLIVVAMGGQDVAPQIEAVRKDLRETLIASAPKVQFANETPPVGADPTSWLASQEKDRVSVLALVCPADHVQEKPWHEQRKGRAGWTVLPIFPKGANPSTAFTSEVLKSLNATFWTVLATECLPAILACGGLTTMEQRVFISYRRIETQPLADQLFDALTHDGFDVFVDRFSVPPGVDFQKRLDQDLTDKSMVVLLESEGVPDSEWTQHEIDFAKRHRLGLAALTMPEAMPLASVDDECRLRLEKEHFAAAPDLSDGKDGKKIKQWGELEEDQLREVVLWIKKMHDAAQFRRRKYLRDNLNAALAQAKVAAATLDSNGFMVTRNASKDYAFWLTTRSVDVSDFEIAHARTPPKTPATCVIVGLPAIEDARKKRVLWLSDLCKLLYVKEDDLMDTVRQIGKGDL